MGWTNSVPIFHDDVTYILQEEIPHLTWPYIDDVPTRGPETRCFVWEHLNNVNRIVQCIKYAGGTFSGIKSVLCADEITVVGAVILAVDTSWMAVGFGIFQEDGSNPKIRTCARLGSITLNEREARFSQSKRELYSLMRALQVSSYWLLGCRKLIVESDAKYLKGMLSNPGIGPNATIMHWVEAVLMYHFTLRHVPGKTFSMDDLSCREKQPGDEEYAPVDQSLLDDPKPMIFEYPDEINKVPGWEEHVPLKLEDFIDEIDTRGDY
ncbi:hypothetical protein J132_03854 [Termitomyces sp. J132]|nr:hypothetical protein J132_03854 [Termitomyces sp. J132]